MSILCEALIALGLAFGGVCADPGEPTAPLLPEGDSHVWDVSPSVPDAAPEPAPDVPFFPAVIIQETVEKWLPSPVSSIPEVTPAAEPVAPPPSPLRLALEAVLSGNGSSRRTEIAPGIATGTVAGGGVLPASFTPPAGDNALALHPVTSQERYEAESVTSSLPVDNTRILAADRYISGILETGLNSQLESTAGGQAIIQVSRDVFGYHGRLVLIPKGSRLICDYQSPGRQGDSRIAFSCFRILLGEHRAEILQLSAVVGDMQGRGGVSGELDNRFWERYGTAFLLTGVSTSMRFASALGSSNSVDSPLGNAADKSSAELSKKLGEITASILEQTINLAPIVTIAQGTRVQIRPAKDWYIHEIGEEQ